MNCRCGLLAAYWFWHRLFFLSLLTSVSVSLLLTEKYNFLGISIVGQSNERGDGGIYIGSIMKGGAVAADGRIEPGDMLLQVCVCLCVWKRQKKERDTFEVECVFLCIPQTWTRNSLHEVFALRNVWPIKIGLIRFMCHLQETKHFISQNSFALQSIKNVAKDFSWSWSSCSVYSQ